MAARSAPRGHMCRRSGYCVEQVDEIIRTEATWRCWLPIEPLGLADAVLPLPGLLPVVEPVAPVPPVELEPLANRSPQCR